MHSQILPLSTASGANWLKTISTESDLQTILSNVNGMNGTVKRRVIAMPDGSTYNVTIHYTNEVSGNVFDPGDAVKKIFPLGNSILQLGSGQQSSTWELTGIWHSYLQQILTLADQLRSFQGLDFETNFNTQIQDLLEDQLTTVSIKQTTNLDINISLDAILAAYTKAYLDGTYVDRWGVPVSQPDLTKIGSDTVGPFTKVILEGLFDYSLMTPIVHDPNQSNTNKTPTFAIIFPQLYESVSTNSHAPGVTQPELEAINYLSGLSDEGAKHLSSLIIKSIGGASVGVKVSTGDNSTLSEIISTLCEEVSRRTTEETSYRFFEKFEYYPSTNSLGYEPDLEANDTNLFQMDPPAQEAVVALLVCQDNLENLLSGGWKLSANSITNYEALASKLANTNNVLSTRVFSMLSPEAQTIITNNGTPSSDQQQALIADLNRLIQTNHPIYEPSNFPAILVSPETSALLQQNPQGVALSHLNWQLLLDAFPDALSSGQANHY